MSSKHKNEDKCIDFSNSKLNEAMKRQVHNPYIPHPEEPLSTNIYSICVYLWNVGRRLDIVMYKNMVFGLVKQAYEYIN